MEIRTKLRNHFLGRKDEGIGNGKAQVVTAAHDLGGNMYKTC